MGWATSAFNDRSLALQALDRALRSRRPGAGLLHHSDRGSPYASEDYRAALARSGLRASMSRNGDCWDNAVAESFFGTLRAELVDHERYPTRAAAVASIGDYVERFYNPVRRHSSLGYVSPVEFELKRRIEAMAASSDCPPNRTEPGEDQPMVTKKSDPTTAPTRRELTILRDLLTRAPHEYRSKLRRIEATITRRVWETDPCHTLQPYDAEARSFAPGHELDTKPDALWGTFEFGFDAVDHIVLSREHGESSDFADEELLDYSSNEASAILWRRTAHQVSVARATVFEFDTHGTLRSVEASARGGVTVRSYQRDRRHRVVSFSITARATRRASPTTRRFSVDYDIYGQMRRITEHVGPKTVVRFERPAGSHEDALRQLRQVLTIEITAALKKWRGRRAYSLYLEYSSDSLDELIHPAICLNVEHPGAESRNDRWDLGDHPWRQRVPLGGPRVERACRRVREHLRMLGTIAPATSVLADVATILNVDLSSGALDVTDDFVVVPVDVERGISGVIAAILAVAPGERVKILRERGLLD